MLGNIYCFSIIIMTYSICWQVHCLPQSLSHGPPAGDHDQSLQASPNADGMRFEG